MKCVGTLWTIQIRWEGLQLSDQGQGICVCVREREDTLKLCLSDDMEGTKFSFYILGRCRDLFKLQ